MNNSPDSNPDLATQELHAADAIAPGHLLLDRFRITAKLGEGAQASVYQARDELLETDIAIKLVPGNTALSMQLQQVRNEVLVARRIQHPNVIQVHDVFSDGELVFFTMALVQGEPLVEHLHKSVSKDLYEKWSRQLLDAIHACQQQQLIHGDIKPDNIIITPDQNLLLIDFGIGNASDDSAQLSGHPDYAAPEILQSGKSSEHSDTYSAGKVLQQLLNNVSLSTIAPTDLLWRMRQQKRISRLTHPVAELRSALTQELHRLNADTKPQSSKFWPVTVLFSVSIIFAMSYFLMKDDSSTELRSKPVWQIALVEDPGVPVLQSISELLQFPLQSEPGLVVISNEQIRKMRRNLALQPFDNEADRVNIASTLGADILLLLRTADVTSETILLQAEALIMPSGSRLFSHTQSINLTNLDQQLNQFAINLANELVGANEYSGKPADTTFLQSLPIEQLDITALQNQGTVKLLQAEAPAFPGGWVAGVELAWQQGDIEAMQLQLNELKKIDSADEYWLLHGQYFQAQIDDNLALAKQSIERLISLYPDRVALLKKRADVHLWENNMPAAIEDYRQALKLTPYDGNIWFEVGKLRIMQGEIKQAVAEELTQALSAFRQLADVAGEGLVLNAFGVAHLRLADYEVAERYFEDALQLRDAETQPSERATTLANLANVAAINRHFELAESALSEASALLKNLGDRIKQAHVLDTLGFILEEQGRYEEALRYYKEGLDIRVQSDSDTKKAESMSNVAYMHFLTGNFSLSQIFWQQAETLFERAQDQAFLLRTWQNLAQLSLAKGDVRRAGQYLHKVATQLDAQQLETDMINRLLFSYLHFYQGKLAPALENLSIAKKRANEIGDVRALTEVQLWHAEICLYTADLPCISQQLSDINKELLTESQEQQAVYRWLAAARDHHNPDIQRETGALLDEALQYGSVPLLTEIKILLDLQERFDLPLDSEVMQTVEGLMTPVYHSAYLQWLFLHASHGNKQAELVEQLVLAPQYWRSHIYYRALPADAYQNTQQELQQQWLAQLTEAQSGLYRDWYLD
ncbi:MAG: protein kinase [Aestuariibacter sp.]